MPEDVRGQLPLYNNGRDYKTRDVNGLLGVDLHYTAGPPGQTVEQVAAYQVSNAAIPQTGAGIPFPGLAYTMYVEADGSVKWAWDLNVRVWHNAGADHNRTHIGICYSGNHMPNDQQIVGIGRAIGWLQRRLGRPLVVEGHKDHYSTSCPGPMWPTWKQRVLNNIT